MIHSFLIFLILNIFGCYFSQVFYTHSQIAKFLMNVHYKLITSRLHYTSDSYKIIQNTILYTMDSHKHYSSKKVQNKNIQCSFRIPSLDVSVIFPSRMARTRRCTDSPRLCVKGRVVNKLTEKSMIA